MLKVVYKRGFLRMMNGFEVANGEYEKSADTVITTNVVFPDKPTKINLDYGEAGINLIGKTLLIDLDRSEEEIFAEIHKNARYKINRAIKRDSVQYNITESPSDIQLQEFVTFFNGFAKQKKIPPANLERLKSFRDQNSLTLSYITDGNESMLCAHIHYMVNNYSCLLFSCSARFENSQIRNLIGRANRYLHWQDIKQTKAKGLKWYNFGGLSEDENDIPHQKINQFKMEFGGQVVNVLTRVYGLTLFGKIAVLVYKLKARNRVEYVNSKDLLQHLHYSHQS